MADYRTREGDVLDRVLWEIYGGRRVGLLERTLATNMGLAAHGETLPGGLLISLPEEPIAPAAHRVQRLWEGTR